MDVNSMQQQEGCVGISSYHIQATKMMKTTRKKMIAANILIKSHLFDDIWLRCLNRELRAPSTLAND